MGIPQKGYQRLWEIACVIQDEAFHEGDEVGFRMAAGDILFYERMMGENLQGRLI